jgi:hypothetical protein
VSPTVLAPVDTRRAEILEVLEAHGETKKEQNKKSLSLVSNLKAEGQKNDDELGEWKSQNSPRKRTENLE